MALTSDQILILGVLLATVAMFLWGRWRHDMVAAGALLACVVAGLVPFADAFTGFGHPAVITAACVLVLSQPIGHQKTINGDARPTLHFDEILQIFARHDVHRAHHSCRPLGTGIHPVERYSGA